MIVFFHEKKLQNTVILRNYSPPREEFLGIFVSQDSVSKPASWHYVLIFLGTGLFSLIQQALKSKTNI